MYLLMIPSILAAVLQNCLYNSVCKKDLHTGEKINAFNAISYAVCIIAFGIVTVMQGISLFTFLLGLGFGIVTALAVSFKMSALSIGPMHITLLIVASSMIIPTLSGVLFGEKVSFYKVLFVAVLLFFIYLSLDKVGNIKANGKWFLLCGISFVLSGSIGVLQKVHQSTVYKGETGGFLFSAFLCSVFLSVFFGKKELVSTVKSVRLTLISAVCGLFTFTMHFINLKLSGVLNPQIFFPIVNSVPMTLSTLCSVFLFKEHLSLKQIIGLIGSVACLVAICLVP